MFEDIDRQHITEGWDPATYLRDYYSIAAIPRDEEVMFRFVADGLRQIGRRFDRGLELGCGPVLHHAAQLVPWVDRLDMADYLEANLDELQRWLARAPGAHDWSVYLGAPGGALDADGGGSVAEREALLRERVQLLRCDLGREAPLGTPVQYPLVATFYCLEWVVPTTDGWRQTMSRVADLVSPGGWLFVVGVGDTEFCRIGSRRCPCARVSLADLEAALVENGFDRSTLVTAYEPGRDPATTGIRANLLSRVRKAG
jgi:hypothetical protein